MNALRHLIRRIDRRAESCRPLSEDERKKIYAGALQELPDYHPDILAARMRVGHAWREAWKKRPIPKHRALVPVSKPRIRVTVPQPKS